MSINSKYQIPNFKTKLINRVHRVRGQIEGIEKMLENDKSCLDLVQQITAVRSALAKVQGLILVNSCRQNKVSQEFDRTIQELTKLL